MTIFRFQDDEGRGPFKPGVTDRWLVEHEGKPVGLIQQIGLHELRKLVVAFSTMFPHREFHYGFGCRSIDGLYRWFTAEERRKMASLGYHLVTMIADHAVAGNRDEIMFARILPFNQRAVILKLE